MRGWNTGIVENLESRRLLSGAVLTSGGVLRVWGDAASVNTVTISNSADNLNVNVSITSVNRLGVSKPFTQSFAKGLGISSVWVRTGFKDDTITISEQNGVFTQNVRVDSGGGNDTVTTASGNDIVFAGVGNDTVRTGNGMDWVRGMLGDDVLDGGGGNDRLNAGAGNDQILGGAGDDSIRGEVGNDTVDAGSGNDLVYGGFGNDNLVGGSGNDALWGGVGDDVLTGGTGNDTLGGFFGTNTLNGEGGQDTFIVRQLSANPTNDFDALEDILLTVTRPNEGGKPPVM